MNHQASMTPSIALFRGLEKRDVDLIQAAATRRTFKATETIIRSEDPALQLFLIDVGAVDYYVLKDDGRKILLHRLLPGNIFGVAAFLAEPTGYLGSAEAVRVVDANTWDHQAVRRFATIYPQLAENALRIALHYVAIYAKRHISVVTDSAQERLAWVLTNLGSRAGHVLAAGVEIEIRNEDLASLADVNFFTVSRLLQRWERRGAIEKTRGKVLIRSPEKMLAA